MPQKETKSPLKGRAAQRGTPNAMTAEYLRFVLECVDHYKSHIDFECIARDQNSGVKNVRQKFERAKAHSAALEAKSAVQADDMETPKSRHT